MRISICRVIIDSSLQIHVVQLRTRKLSPSWRRARPKERATRITQHERLGNNGRCERVASRGTVELWRQLATPHLEDLRGEDEKVVGVPGC